jgi:hypothetical protein
MVLFLFFSFARDGLDAYLFVRRPCFMAIL